MKEEMQVSVSIETEKELKIKLDEIIDFIKGSDRHYVCTNEHHKIKDSFIDKEKLKNANIYCIYSSLDKIKWDLKYIGTRKRGNLKTRLSNHLLGKSIATGTKSKFHFIEEELKKKKHISIKVISIKEDSLRMFFEEKLIEYFLNLNNKKLWNNKKDRAFTKNK